MRRVLVVDDTPDIRELLTLILDQAPDFAVVGVAENGRVGIALAERERPDVVLLDLAMPVMDGLEALPRLRAVLRQATIVVLSGFGTGAMAPQALGAGADAYLEKGTPAKQLVERLREVVGERDPGVPPPPFTGQVPGPSPPREAPLDDGAATRDTGEVSRLRQAIATTAHEIRNPVTVLRGVLEAFDDDFEELTEERRQRLLAAFGRQVQLLDSMCADMLTSAHAGRGQLEIVPTVFDLLGALRGITDDMPKVSLHHDPEIAELLVSADRGRLEQMVTNLLTNAVKYGAPPVELRAWRQESGRLRISVSDRGPGVPPAFQPRLFDEFARADTPSRIAGNGLGLFVVKHLAAAHGGRVEYVDRPGGGAVFTLDVDAGTTGQGRSPAE